MEVCKEHSPGTLPVHPAVRPCGCPVHVCQQAHIIGVEDWFMHVRLSTSALGQHGVIDSFIYHQPTDGLKTNTAAIHARFRHGLCWDNPEPSSGNLYNLTEILVKLGARPAVSTTLKKAQLRSRVAMGCSLPGERV